MKLSISFLFAILTAAQCLAQTFSSLAIFIDEDETGKPVTGASVIIKEAGWASKTTGNDGKAFFDKSMPIGEIHYIISKEGYQGVEGTFNITTEEKSNSLKIKLSKFRDDRLLITGEVVDDYDRDLEGAIVEVKVADIIKTSKTDVSGNYKIELTLNRTQYDVSILKLEAKCANGSGKKTETIDLTRRNVIYKDFKLDCGTTKSSEEAKHSNAPSSRSKILAEKNQNGAKLSIEKFEQRGTVVTFYFTLENLTPSTTVRESTIHGHQGEFIDQNGATFQSTYVSVGNIEGPNYVRIKLIYGTPVKGYIQFDVGAVKITKASLLKMSLEYIGVFEFVNLVP